METSDGRRDRKKAEYNKYVSLDVCVGSDMIYAPTNC